MVRETRISAALVMWMSAATFTLIADGPRELNIDGVRLSLNGEAVRSELLGMIELYRIGLYLRSPAATLSSVSADAPQALRLQILHDTRSTRLPESWREELSPALTLAERQTLQVVYKRLDAGDIVIISYLPGKGSRVMVNDDVVLRSEGRELMLAFLDQWLGQDPISDEIKLALLNRP